MTWGVWGRDVVHLQFEFTWYEDDFGCKEGVLSLVMKYRYDLEEKAFLQNALSELRIAYQDYDWSLNVV